MLPKISVIMPTFNQGDFIERAILSVLSQNYPNLEFIIIDNLSSDQTESIINKYKDNIDLYIREPDSGQSNAINKGFKLATGDFFTWLNSDDILLPNSLRNFSISVNSNPEVKWFMGNLIWIDIDDNILKCRKGENYSYLLAKNFKIFSYGPSSFLHKDLFKKYGYLREDMHYMMDTEFWLRLLSNNQKIYRLKEYIWGFRIHQDAKMSGHNFKDSVFNDENHPSRLQKNLEFKLINDLYYSKISTSIFVYFYFYFHRLFSFRYIASFIDGYIYKGKNIYHLFK